MKLNYCAEHRKPSARWYEWCHRAWKVVPSWPVRQSRHCSQSPAPTSLSRRSQVMWWRCLRVPRCLDFSKLFEQGWAKPMISDPYDASLLCPAAPKTMLVSVPNSKTFHEMSTSSTVVFWPNLPLDTTANPTGKGRCLFFSTNAGTDWRLHVCKKTWKVQQPSFMLHTATTIFRAHWCPQQTLQTVVLPRCEDKFHRLAAIQHNVDDRTRSFLKIRVTLTTFLCVINGFLLRKLTFKYEAFFTLSGGMSDSDFSHAVISVNVPLDPRSRAWRWCS